MADYNKENRSKFGNVTAELPVSQEVPSIFTQSGISYLQYSPAITQEFQRSRDEILAEEQAAVDVLLQVSFNFRVKFAVFNFVFSGGITF